MYNVRIFKLAFGLNYLEENSPEMDQVKVSETKKYNISYLNVSCTDFQVAFIYYVHIDRGGEAVD